MKKTLLFVLLILFAVCLLACKDKTPVPEATTDPVTTRGRSSSPCGRNARRVSSGR